MRYLEYHLDYHKYDDLLESYDDLAKRRIFAEWLRANSSEEYDMLYSSFIECQCDGKIASRIRVTRSEPFVIRLPKKYALYCPNWAAAVVYANGFISSAEIDIMTCRSSDLIPHPLESLGIANCGGVSFSIGKRVVMDRYEWCITNSMPSEELLTYCANTRTDLFRNIITAVVFCIGDITRMANRT